MRYGYATLHGLTCPMGSSNMRELASKRLYGTVIGFWTFASIALAAAQGPSVTVIEARKDRLEQSVMVGGTLVARDEVLVAAQVEGLAIIEILAEEGDIVHEGAVLARLSRETLDASIAQNKAQQARAEAAIAQARSQIVEAEAGRTAASNSLTRAKSLRAEGVTSAETFDQRQAAATQANARVSSAQQALKLAEADQALAEAQGRELAIRLARTDIKAPASGVISRRTARVGAIAAGAADPLFRIIKDSAIELEADSAETSLAKLKIGQKARIQAAGISDTLTGTVRLVSPEVSRTTRLGKVRIALDGSSALAVGAFARASIAVKETEGVILPLSAVQFSSDKTLVQVVKGNVVETRTVTAGLRSSTKVEIVSGLQAGEQVVHIAGTFLRHGDVVTPVMAPALTPARP
jgi:HlyD family secretion protein